MLRESPRSLRRACPVELRVRAKSTYDTFPASSCVNSSCVIIYEVCGPFSRDCFSPYCKHKAPLLSFRQDNLAPPRPSGLHIAQSSTHRCLHSARGSLARGRTLQGICQGGKTTRTNREASAVHKLAVMTNWGIGAVGDSKDLRTPDFDLAGQL